MPTPNAYTGDIVTPATTAPHIVFLSAVAVIALGYLIRKTGLVTRDAGATLAKIVINVTLPAVILETVPAIDFRLELLFLPLLALLHAAVAFAITVFFFQRRPPAQRGLMMICAMGFNNGLFAFPIALGIWGPEAIRLLAVFDVGNGLVVLGTNYVVASWFGAQAAAARLDHASGAAPLQLGATLRHVARTIGTSIPMITFAVAVVLNLTGLQLPTVAMRAVSSVAAANGALALLVLGIFQSLSVHREDLGIIVRVLGLRYLLGAVMAVASIAILGSTELLRNILAIVFILPVGMTVIPFSVEFDLNPRLATTMVNISIVVSFLVMWAVV